MEVDCNYSDFLQKILILIVSRILEPDCTTDHPQYVIVCSLARDTPLIKVSCKSVHYFVSNRAGGQTDKQTMTTSRYQLVVLVHFWDDRPPLNRQKTNIIMTAIKAL